LPKCPGCKAEVEQLEFMASGLITYKGGEWLRDGDPEEEYFCTECGAKVSLDTLITDET